MAELKTKVTKESVNDFLSKVADERRRKDCLIVLDLMKDDVDLKVLKQLVKKSVKEDG